MFWPPTKMKQSPLYKVDSFF